LPAWPNSNKKKTFQGLLLCLLFFFLPPFYPQRVFSLKKLVLSSKILCFFFVREERERSLTLNLPLHFSIVRDQSPPFRVMKTQRERKTRRVIKKSRRATLEKKKSKVKQSEQELCSIFRGQGQGSAPPFFSNFAPSSLSQAHSRGQQSVDRNQRCL
jgi:hypothetical protein